MLAYGWRNVGLWLVQRWLVIVGETLAYSWFGIGLWSAKRSVMVGTLLVFGWCNVISWLAQYCFNGWRLVLGQRYFKDLINIGSYKYAAVGPTLIQCWVLVGQWLAC